MKDLKIILNISPNPFSNTIEINCNSQISSIEILDIDGKIRIYEKINALNASINTINLNSGVYFVKIQNLSYFSSTIWS